jgi:hypothetical protein
MKTATSLALVAIGAILAFAITRSPSFLNLQIVGWVLMLTGAIGAVLPRRGSGWLRRSTVVESEDATQTGPAGEAVTETETVEVARPQAPRFSRLLVPGGRIGPRRVPAQPAGEVKQEYIEEYIEE